MTHPEAVFYVNLLSASEVRNGLDSVEKCQEIIDSMEEHVPHDQLPPCYDVVVARRNRLSKEKL